jgi:hypothetical protein
MSLEDQKAVEQTQIAMIVVGALLGLSEILGSFPQFRSNSVFQLLKNLISDLYRKLRNE